MRICGVTKCELCGAQVSEKARNYQHHKKLFVLFKIGFDNWEPLESQHAAKNLDQFRRDVMIMSGHCDPVYTIDGNITLVPHSLSYSKMGKEQFEQAYQDCLHVIADRVLRCGRDDLHDMIMMEF